MRGFFGRNRMEKPQPGLVVHSYEDALYPPRPYRYHIQQQSFPSPQPQPQSGSSSGNSGPPIPPLIVLPSIDSDTICEPHARQPVSNSAAAAAGIVLDKRPPPTLRDYFDCYVPAQTGLTLGGCSDEPLSFFTHYSQEGWTEPLNVFHYPDALVDRNPSMQAATATTTTTAATSTCAATHEERHRTLAILAEILQIPTELRTFVTAVGPNGAVKAPEKLRIRAINRRRPPRPIRRGAKVTVEAVEEPRRAVGGATKRHRGEEDGEDGSGKRSKEEGDDVEGDAAADDGDDEISVGFVAEDDDDNADMDDVGGGSDDGGDFF